MRLRPRARRRDARCVPRVEEHSRLDEPEAVEPVRALNTTSDAALARIVERLDRIYAIGGGPGANRRGLSDAEQEAHDLVAGWMRAAALEIEPDPWGNLFGRLPGEDPEAPELWVGSHLDSVPEGGRFDGPLGVLGALEAVERVAAGGTPRRTLAVVAWRDEEGGAFLRGYFGSRARFGCLDEEEAKEAAARGLGPYEPKPLPGGYLELHIEQGPVLERAGIPLGIVTSIAGQARGIVVFDGEARHAGTTPMDARDDALCRAAELVLHARDSASAIPSAVATVGRLEVEPGASNVVPGRVTLSVDARAPDQERLDALLERLGLELAVTAPSAMDPRLMDVLREEIERRGLPTFELPSGAGHDAGIVAAAGAPAGMLFVRSARGISHHPEEETSTEDVALAVDVLSAAVGRLAAG
ncbi:MAG TPA: Zn-dependent hydrolase [Gaiellaceae bacterium]